MNAPFLVPTNTRTLLMFILLSDLMISQYVPTKINFYTDDLVVFDTDDFRVASFVSIRLRDFISHNYFFIVLYQPQEVEFLAIPRSRPASLKISIAIKSHIERTRESKILCKMLFKKFPVAGCKGLVRLLRELELIITHIPPALAHRETPRSSERAHLFVSGSPCVRCRAKSRAGHAAGGGTTQPRLQVA